jgi:hypothetical protein
MVFIGNDTAYPIPMECTMNIFSYLQLADCIRFASTSSMSLREVLPTIHIRRGRMTKTYAIIATKTTASSNTFHTHVRALEDTENDTDNVECLYKFPTLQQRVTQLASKIPYTHPMHPIVQRLNMALTSCTNNESVVVNEYTSYTELIESLQMLILPLKLHAAILFNTILSNHCYQSTTTTLHNYIGDVLCVTYLFYNLDQRCSYDYAEGSITSHWLQQKLRRYTPTCYQSWVLIHSSILRTKQFTKQQRIRLGLSDELQGGYTNLNNVLANNIKENVSLSKIYGWNIPIDLIRTDQFVKSEMCIVYDDFGPLGPSFRGRDIVRVRDLTADAIVECLLYYNNNNHNENNTPTSIMTQQLQHPRNVSSTREAFEWICIVHEQAFQSRPMSVRLPMVRFN